MPPKKNGRHPWQDRLRQGEARLMAKKNPKRQTITSGCTTTCLRPARGWVCPPERGRSMSRLPFATHGFQQWPHSHIPVAMPRANAIWPGIPPIAPFKELVDAGFIEETLHGGLSRKTHRERMAMPPTSVT